MNKDEAKAIWNRYLQGEASDSEKNFIEAWYNKAIDEQSDGRDNLDWEAIEMQLSERLPKPRSKNRYILLQYSVAAVAILLMATILTLHLKSPRVTPIPVELVNKVILPGGNKATLQLTNGKIIQLSEQQETIVVRNDSSCYPDGTLISEKIHETENLESVYPMELRTPLGGQYKIILSDGTKVWLNASSLLTYPRSFAHSSERTVKLEGEAYFEVAHNPNKPFKVQSKGQTIRVLGTHFNINAYDDEPNIKTTLLEGRVAVELPSGKSQQIMPSQQSLVNTNLQQINIRNVEVSDIIDWKNGDFTFNNASIGDIMRKISRWYNVDIEFRGRIEHINFGGIISRSKNITEVLQLLELTGAVHFKYQNTKNIGKGRRIVVMP